MAKRTLWTCAVLVALSAVAGAPPAVREASPQVAEGAAARPQGLSNDNIAWGEAVEGKQEGAGLTAWGSDVNGLQAGLSYDLGKRPYRIGETLSFGITVRNMSDQTVQLKYFQPALLWLAPTVIDEDDNKALAWLFDGLVRPVTRSLAGGRAMELGKARLRRWLADEISGRRTEPLAVEKVRAKAMVATYILAECGDFEALPLLREGFETQMGYAKEIKRVGRPTTTVPPALTLYAMHRLLAGYPQERLGPEALEARADYLAWAKDHIPPPKGVVGTDWHADYDESDPFRRIADPEGKVLRYQPKMTLPVYPLDFADGVPIEEYLDSLKPEVARISPRVEEWRDRLFEAVDAVIIGRGLPE